MSEENMGHGCAAPDYSNKTTERPSIEGLQKIVDGCPEATAPPKTMMALSSSAAETLRCLFFHGPTWDGNVPSKSGRDELVNMGLAQCGKGWQWLTRAGIDVCFGNGIHDEKDRRESRERMRRIRLEEAARTILS